jgi:rSAM/selenodomain-associated transferase 1
MVGDPGSTLLIQFARAPVPGRVKTRMLPELSEAAACELHRALVLWTCRRLVGSRIGPVQLAVTGAPADPLFRQCTTIGASAILVQRGRDLGERMHHALAEGLREYAKVVVVGSDCPAIDGAYVSRARDALDGSPVVLGPAVDGGYVLVGLTAPLPGLFEAMPWGTGKVLAETRRRLRAMHLIWAELEPLADIDEPRDLAVWERVRGAGR